MTNLCDKYKVKSLVFEVRVSRVIQKHNSETKMQNVGVSFQQNCRLKGLQLYQKETPTQVLSCEICYILRTTILKKICERLLLILQEESMNSFSRILHLKEYLCFKFPTTASIPW